MKRLSGLLVLSGRISRGAVFGLLILMGFWAAGAHAQSTFGTIRGTTLDQTNSFIPDAQVTLHNADENTDFTISSDDHGNFVFENLKPGHYSLAASQGGLRQSNCRKSGIGSAAGPARGREARPGVAESGGRSKRGG